MPILSSRHTNQALGGRGACVEFSPAAADLGLGGSLALRSTQDGDMMSPTPQRIAAGPGRNDTFRSEGNSSSNRL